MKTHTGDLGIIAQHWFEVMRKCGDDVRELLHDEHPTACIADAAFGYVNAFKAHVNVGFFRGAEIADPEGLLEGTGKFMRHVKPRSHRDVNVTALSKLIDTAYTDMKERVRAELQRARSCYPPPTRPIQVQLRAGGSAISVSEISTRNEAPILIPHFDTVLIFGAQSSKSQPTVGPKS